MKFILKHYLLILCCMLLCIQPISAEYNPTNPAEPNVYYKISVKATPSNSANVSGIGKYSAGTRVYVNCSAQSTNYVFDHWELDGEFYSSSKSFYYTVTAKDVSLVAVLYYDPKNPTEPSTAPTKKNLYIESSPQGACSFNRTNGEKVIVESSINVTAYANSGYDFLGWFVNDEKISDKLSFTYTMPSVNTTLQARFVYNPTNPSEPESFLDETTEIEKVTNTKPFYRIESGRIICDEYFRIYNLLGNDVTHANGHLHGVFILKTHTNTIKIALK